MISLDFSNIGRLEVDYVLNSLERGYVSTAGPQVNEVERRMIEFLHVKDAVATNSGTAALHLALIALGVGPGDDVILPVTTFVATANAVKYCGATPVFVDIRHDTWLMDAGEVYSAVTDKTKAIIGVDLYGNIVDWKEISESLPSRLRTNCISDAAESFGVNVYTGHTPCCHCYSFNGNKLVTAGGGGLLASKHYDLSTYRSMSQQAKDSDGVYFDVGYNYRMTNLSAGLLLAQFQRVNDLLEKKRRISEIYREELKDNLQFQRVRRMESSYWYTAAKLPERVSVKYVQENLQAEGIPTRRIFRPLTDSRPYYELDAKNRYPAAYELYERGLCLPSGTLNTEEDIYDVCEIIKGCL